MVWQEIQVPKDQKALKVPKVQWVSGGILMMKETVQK